MSLTSAGVAVLNESGALLILRCYKYWDLPKGGLEKGEDPFDAAVRELGEEAGIKNASYLEVEPLDVSYQLKSNKKTKTIRVYFAQVADDTEVTISNEHHDFLWVPLEAAKAILPDRFHPVVDRCMELMEN